MASCLGPQFPLLLRDNDVCFFLVQACWLIVIDKRLETFGGGGPGGFFMREKSARCRRSASNEGTGFDHELHKLWNRTTMLHGPSLIVA